MDKAHLEAKQKEASDKFDALQQEKTSHQERIDEINIELLKLQGQHQGYGDLIKELDSQEDKPDANTVVAVEDTEKDTKELEK